MAEEERHAKQKNVLDRVQARSRRAGESTGRHKGPDWARAWHQCKHDHALAFLGKGAARDEEMAALKRELNRVKKERDFLREAATFFAKDPK